MRRAGMVVFAGALVAVCILAAVAALSYLLLLLGQNSSSAALSSPEEALFNLLGAIFTVILTGIAIRYAYYYYCWWTSRRYFTKPPWIDTSELATRELPYLKFQITTKGGALPVVERSLRVLEAMCARHPWLNARVNAEVITERTDEADHLQAAFRESVLDVTAIALPAEYQTPKGSRLKARALHYLCERRREGFNARPGRTFIVHFDEETVMTEPHVMLLLDYLTKGHPPAITQGPILYPLEWMQAPWVCRAIESTRPFGCAECARVMQNPPPPHLHGSNLVVDEAVENWLGWDFGTLDGEAFVAEDLLFGLRAYAILGEEAFGWHGATAIEQPPLSLFWAVQQRMRWVLGALQGLRAMWKHRDYDRMDRERKLWLSLSVYARIATYSLGFPVGLTGLVFVFHPLVNTPDAGSPMFALRILFLLSAAGWFASYQIGMRRNLQYQDLPWIEKLSNHAVMFVATPIVGLFETVGPFVALIRWLAGSRAAQWTPTPKVADAPAVSPIARAEGGVEAQPTEVPVMAPIPAWVFARPDRPGDVQPKERKVRRGPAFTTARILWPVGLCILAFLAYEFLITGVLYNRSQTVRLTSFQQGVADGTLADAAATPAEGDAVALLKIPKIHVDSVVVEGTSPDDLKGGPGHFRGSPRPGEFGNAVIAGRRTTYGGTFRDLDRLAKGDKITVTTGQGSFDYKVSEVARTGAGSPDPLNGTLDSRLTLLTSDPAFVPDGRLAIVATLQGKPIDVPNRGLSPVSSVDFGLTGDSIGLGLAVFWGVLLGVAIFIIARFAKPWPMRVRYLVAAPVITLLAVLLMTSVDRILPGTL